MLVPSGGAAGGDGVSKLARVVAPTVTPGNHGSAISSSGLFAMPTPAEGGTFSMLTNVGAAPFPRRKSSKGSLSIRSLTRTRVLFWSLEPQG